MAAFLKTSLLALMLSQSQSASFANVEPMSLMGQVDLQVIYSVFQYHCLNLKAISPAVQPKRDSDETAFMDFRKQALEEIQHMQKQVEAGEMTEEEFLKRQRALEDELRNRYQQLEAIRREKIEALSERFRLQKERYERNLQEAVEQIAHQNGLNLVVRKQIALFPSFLGPPNISEYALSGRDITQDVLALMAQKGWCKNL